jgi:uncharacterized protein (DUF305 family)
MQMTLSSLSAVVLLSIALLGPSTVRAEEPAPDPVTAAYETRFMTRMIDHHTMAVMMGEACLERALHAELRAMCQDIVANQSAEVEMMQTWLQEWYDVTYMPDVNLNRMSHLMSLSGEEFEVAFMRSMIRHHLMAVREGTQCVERAYHPDLVAMCTDIVRAQLEEIQTLRTWLCQWYGICRGGGGGHH